MSKAKYWCFTLNNPTQDEIVKLGQCVDNKEVSYLCYGKELSESGTDHLQGYLELQARKRLGQLKSLVSNRAHFEVRKGTSAQAIEYCQKDGDFIEFGVVNPTKPGQRNDLLSAKGLIDEGKTLLDVADEHFGVFLRYEKSLRSYILLKSDKRNWETEVIVYWGDTGLSYPVGRFSNANIRCW